MIHWFTIDKPKSVAFDTETTGLHIIKDKPFLIQLGWNHKVFTFEPTEELMQAFFRICSSVKWVFGANIGFDCHMLANLGYRAEVEKMNNLCDVQAIARLVLEAKSVRDGGEKLALTSLGVNYIHPYAVNSEKMVKAGLKKLNDERVAVLAAALRQFPIENQFTPTGRQQYWGKGAIEKFMKNITNDIDDLPEGVRDVWLDWLEEYPEPNYSHIDRDLMIQYAGEDVATTLMLAELFMPTVIQREQMPILQLERDCLLPTFRMERVGLKVDLEYLEVSRIRMKNYIAEKRKELWEICGEEITVNQSVRIMQIYDEKFNIGLDSSDKKEMLLIQKNFTGQPKRLAELISNLRSAEKWYQTYIVGLQKNAEYDGRGYTQINLNGAVSGRMSSNFQQFPRGPFITLEGEELYHPRQAFIADRELVFGDYSQVELRIQAHYTILTTGGDMNLCRAYMPFRCYHYKTREEFDFRSLEGRNRWDEKQENGESAWLTEKHDPWTPTDLHSMTASKAYPEVPMDSPEFRKPNGPRDKGKTTNFAANYGASALALVESLGISWEEAEKLINGYNEAFPGVIAYQQAIQQAHSSKGYVRNHFGRRYYLKDSRYAYRLANYVVQGSAADILKIVIIQIDKLLQNYKTRMVLPVHDELVFSMEEGEDFLVDEIQRIMIDAFSWCTVPVSVGIDSTKTSWRAAE